VAIPYCTLQNPPADQDFRRQTGSGRLLKNDQGGFVWAGQGEGFTGNPPPWGTGRGVGLR